VDVRVIAATNRSLPALLKSGDFRTDLYYRLQVIEIEVPPLRARRSEILPFVEFFLLKYAARYRRRSVPLSEAMRDAFLAYPWPGNVRELENIVKRFVILQDERLVLSELADRGASALWVVAPEPATADRPVPAPDPDRAEGITLLQLSKNAAIAAERRAIERALTTFRWNRRQAARRLGVSYKTLLNKMKECGITENPAVDS
jgi:DNA-binding NtrC family response regulator